MQNNPDPSTFDIAVIGGGHAGCEAALAAARMGLKTTLITHSINDVALMPCNPAVGGIAKSHLVFELDALGGEMPVNADCTGIQFRVLNTKKGPAVQANRVQSDKERYSSRMRHVLLDQTNLHILEGDAIRILTSGRRTTGVSLRDGRTVHAQSVILTAGTFLAGAIHMGARQWPGGRLDAPTGEVLRDGIRELGIRTSRLKTGTPPRLSSRTIDYDRMTEQPGTDPAPFFSWQARREADLFHVEQSGKLFHVEQSVSPLRPWKPGSDQIPCHLTHTTEKTHEIVAKNLERSSLYGGGIKGAGVRYCPSIEDKIVKFGGRTSHHVFVEPEGRDSDWVYPNGLSNSLPEDIQDAMVHSVPGLEEARILRYGYAIEYDFCDPTQLTHALESKVVENLFLAGQVNGTTGYEEAAVQGFMAGVNAALKIKGKPPALVGRGDGYIGVLIDDLVLKGTDEPYRMFTSRAEYRLLLRQDNARFRMSRLSREIGLAQKEYLDETERYEKMIAEEILRLTNTRHGGKALADILARPEVVYATMPGCRDDLPRAVIEQVELHVKYRGYIERDLVRIRKTEEMDRKIIPSDFDFMSRQALSYEAREKLTKIRPRTLGHAARIPGVSPADIAALSVLLAR